MHRRLTPACALLVTLVATAAAARELPRVFIVHSYEQGHVCGQPQHDGILAALAAGGRTEGREYRLQTYYMDTKRTHNTPRAIAEQGRRALAAVRAFTPDVLVTLDDNAFRTVALPLVDSPTQVVFSGMNGQPEEYHRTRPFLETRRAPGHNVTGVYEHLHFADAVRVQHRILPGLRKVRVLSDRSPTGRAITRQVRLELETTTLPVAVDFQVVESWEAYREAITALQADPEVGSLYPAALLLKDAAGRTYTTREIFPWTVAHCTKPAIPINYAFMQSGMFGGAAVDFEAMGRQAGAMVAAILDGTPAGEIPVADAERFALVFNLARARQLDVQIPDDILLAADEVVGLGR